MASVAVVLGSIRPGRAGEQVVRWIEEQSLQVEGVTPVCIDGGISSANRGRL